MNVTSINYTFSPFNCFRFMSSRYESTHSSHLCQIASQLNNTLFRTTPCKSNSRWHPLPFSAPFLGILSEQHHALIRLPHLEEAFDFPVTLPQVSAEKYRNSSISSSHYHDMNGYVFMLSTISELKNLTTVCLYSLPTNELLIIAHEYAQVDGKVATCGITDFAQALLGDIVYVDLPEVGDEVEKGDSIGSVESVKAASDVYAPISGTVTEVNEALADEPGIVNTSAEEKGYFVKIELTDESELEDLMTPESYKEHCEKESEAH